MMGSIRGRNAVWSHIVNQSLDRAQRHAPLDHSAGNRSEGPCRSSNLLHVVNIEAKEDVKG